MSLIRFFFIPSVCSVKTRAWGKDDGHGTMFGYIQVNSVTFLSTSRSGNTNDQSKPTTLSRGIGIVVLTKSCNVSAIYRYDTYSSSAENNNLRNLIKSLPNGTVFIGMTADEASTRLSSETRSTFAAEGVTLMTSMSMRSSLTFIAQKGDPGFVRQAAKARRKGPCMLEGAVFDVPFISEMNDI